MEWDQKRIGVKGLRVPLVLSEIISFLEANALKTEGVLRKCGSTARTKLLKQVRQHYLPLLLGFIQIGLNLCIIT